MEDTKILILETEKRPRLFKTRALLRDGYQVTSISSIEKAVNEAKRQSYELLIVSVDEPELLNMLLAQLPPELNVLIIAREDTVGNILKSSGTGIHSFLIQPFSLDKLKDTVTQTIDRARLVNEGFRSKIPMALEPVNRLFASGVEIDKFFELIVKISAANTKADYVSLLIKDEVTGRFVIQAEIGDHKPAWGEICQQMMKIGKPILIDEATQNPPPSP